MTNKSNVKRRAKVIRRETESKEEDTKWRQLNGFVLLAFEPLFV
jgi:hypothetical protein